MVGIADVDRLTFITPDGVEYMLSAPTWVMMEDGFGMPPLEYVTERGPFQHGETVKDVFLKPRTIQLVVRRNGCSRAEYWNIRAQMLDMLRPGRTQGRPQPSTLRKYLSNGSIRELMVYTSEGPGFPSHDPATWDQWSVQDTIRFTCYDPVARDPRLQSRAYASTGSVGTFPITFALEIASFGIGSQDIVYAGTWQTFPTIIINGPMTSPLVENLTTGEKIQYVGSIASGRVVTMDLSYGNKTVLLDDGTSLIGNISSDSGLATFHLTPGQNSMQVTGTGTSAISSIGLQWYNRYIGM